MSPFRGAFSFVEVRRTHLPYRVIIVPDSKCVRICVVISVDNGLLRKDSTDNVIRCEHKLFTRDGLIKAVFLQLHRYGEVVLFD